MIPLFDRNLTQLETYQILTLVFIVFVLYYFIKSWRLEGKLKRRGKK